MREGGCWGQEAGFRKGTHLSEPSPTPTTWSYCLEAEKSEQTAAGMGVHPRCPQRSPCPETLLGPPSTKANFGGPEHPSGLQRKTGRARKEKAVTFTVYAAPRASTEVGQVGRSAVPGYGVRCSPSRSGSSGPWIWWAARVSTSDCPCVLLRLGTSTLGNDHTVPFPTQPSCALGKGLFYFPPLGNGKTTRYVPTIPPTGCLSPFWLYNPSLSSAVSSIPSVSAGSPAPGGSL